MKRYVLAYLISLVIAFVLAEVYHVSERAYHYLYLSYFNVFFIICAAFYLISYIFVVKLLLSSRINSEQATHSRNFALILKQATKVLLMSALAGCLFYMIDFQGRETHRLLRSIGISPFSILEVIILEALFVMSFVINVTYQVQIVCMYMKTGTKTVGNQTDNSANS